MKYLVMLLVLAAMGCGDDDCEERTDCVHLPTGEVVEEEECWYGRTPGKSTLTDPRDPRGRPYFRTVADYELVEKTCN